MKQARLGTAVVVALIAAGCGNSVDTAPGDPVSPTPTPAGSTGTYSVTAAVPQQVCLVDDDPYETASLTFNVPEVDITIEDGEFTPDWGFVEGPSLVVSDPEHGTITGDDFTANYTYCEFNGLYTTKKVVTWTGTFDEDGSFDSNLNQRLRRATGNLLATCGAGEMDGAVTGDMQACTNPGLTWQVHGEPQE